MKDVVNVIVGSGSARYLENCVRSVQRHSPHNLLVYYNFQSLSDKRNAEAVANRLALDPGTFFLQSNESGARTGSLYECYNHALQGSRGKHRYVSLVQADMQMMWWGQNIIEACDRALDISDLQQLAVLSFYTQFPVAGKRPDFYNVWGGAQSAQIPTHPGMVDVGLFSTERAVEAGLWFTGSESSMSESLALRGYLVGLHPFPFLAPIPYPHNVRQRRLGNWHHRNLGSEATILDFTNEGRRLVKSEGISSFHPVFMEDVVSPNGWACLTPYWPSDTKGSRWVRARLDVTRKLGQPFLLVQPGNHLRRWQQLHFSPGLWRVFVSLAVLAAEEIVRRLTALVRARRASPRVAAHARDPNK